MRVFFTVLILTSTQFVFAQSFKIVTYVPDYRWTVLSHLDYSKTTHVLAAFGNPDAQGDLSFSQDIDYFVTSVHGGGSKALLSIGGGGDYSWGNNYHIYEDLFTAPKRTGFVQKIMAYTRTHNLDGIDLDIEGMALQLANYNVFAQELADSLHQAGFIISASYSAASWAPYVSSTTLAKLDFMMTMSYGGVGDWNWNHPTDDATLAIFKNDIAFWKSLGLDGSKVIGGLPFYATQFPSSQQATYWQFQPTLCSVYEDYASQDPLHHDLVYTTDGDPIYLNSLPTFHKKIKYAVANAGGIMIWEIGGDCYNGSLNILDSLNHYVEKSITAIFEGSSASQVFRFYPNPANTRIEMDGQYQSLNNYIIYNVHGREVKHASIVEKFIDVSSLDPGMYFIDFMEKDRHQTFPLCIQR
jgi:chitinase